MTINEELLFAKAEIKHYKANQRIFCEDDPPFYYYQIIKGKIKMNNYREEGKEFIHNIFSDGQSFGEYVLFSKNVYPTNAETMVASSVFRLKKENFFELIKQDFGLCSELIECLCERTYHKHVLQSSLTAQNPAAKIEGLLAYLKKFENNKGLYTFQVPLTRQQIANLTGLCVETVIRTTKKLWEDKVIEIRGRKIFY
jgi:CRP-like cAMP-binding protein